MIALVGVDASSNENLWTSWLFVVLFAASAVCMVVGVYSLASSYIGLPMPRTLDDRRLPATGATDLADWLGARVKEVRALQRELEGLGPPSPQQHVGVLGVEKSLDHLNQQVRARLLIEAPDWVDYYRENPDWIAEHMLLGDGERTQLHRLLDYTADQLNRICENQR